MLPPATWRLPITRSILPRSNLLPHARQNRIVLSAVSVHHRQIGRTVASIPSMQAEASPRRPILCSTRTFGNTWETARTASGVPSVESLSTNTTSIHQACQGVSQPRQQRHDVRAFIQRGDDYRQLWSTPNRRLLHLPACQTLHFRRSQFFVRSGTHSMSTRRAQKRGQFNVSLKTYDRAQHRGELPHGGTF